MKHGKKFLLVTAVLLTSGLVACSKIPNNFILALSGSNANTETVASNPGVLYGKIVDRQTRAGIPNATVMIKVNGSWVTTTTAGASDHSITDTAGDFTISNLPVASAMALVVKGPVGSSYVVTSASVTIPLVGAFGPPNNQSSLDVGRIQMERGVTVTVRVVDSRTGSYVVNSAGAVAIYVNPLTLSTLDLLATQDATDTNKYTIVVPQTGTTQLLIPAVDTNADGKYEYAAATYTIATNGGVITGQGDLTTVIAMAPVTDSTALAAIASNIVTYGTTAGGATQLAMLASGPISLFYNMPVTVPTTGSDAVTLSYTDNFRYLTVAAVVTEQSVTVATGADGCLVTITPSAALIENKTYTLNGKVFTVAGTLPALTYAAISQSILVKVAGTTALSAAGAITVDNFNFWTNGGIITAGEPLPQAAAQPYLCFPEPVWGNVRVVSATVGATTTIVNGAPVTLTGQAAPTYFHKIASNDANIAINGTATQAGGARTSAALWRWSLAGLAIGVTNDSTAGVPLNFTLGLDVFDANGNTYRAETAFPVQ